MSVAEDYSGAGFLNAVVIAPVLPLVRVVTI